MLQMLKVIFLCFKVDLSSDQNNKYYVGIYIGHQGMEKQNQNR